MSYVYILGFFRGSSGSYSEWEAVLGGALRRERDGAFCYRGVAESGAAALELLVGAERQFVFSVTHTTHPEPYTRVALPRGRSASAELLSRSLCIASAVL